MGCRVSADRDEDVVVVDGEAVDDGAAPLRHVLHERALGALPLLQGVGV